jgi:hypothetical protein
MMVVGGGRARAQSPEAEVLFSDGNRLMTEGKLAEACEAYAASNHIEPRAGTLLRLGECREKNQQLASAWSAYRDALARAQNPRYRVLARAKVNTLEPRLSTLTMVVADDHRVDGMTVVRNGAVFDAVLWNRPLPVDGGDYVIIGRAPGFQEWQTTVHVPVEGGQITVEVPRLDALPAAPAPPPPPAPVEPARPVEVVAAAHPSRVVPIAVGAGGLALLGGALGFELSAESKYSDAKAELKSQTHRNALYDSANTRRYVAEGLAAGGITAGAAAVWLYLRDREHAPPAKLAQSVEVVPTASGLAVWGRF